MFNPVWSADGERIIYAGPTLGAFQTLRAVTPDGRQIVFDRQRENSDIVLIERTR